MYDYKKYELTVKRMTSKYAKRGLEVQCSRVFADDRATLRSVRLKFSDHTWVDLINTNGEILGSCCGTISALRNILIQALRDDGWISVHDLFDAVELMEDHDNDHCTLFKRTPLKRLVEIQSMIKKDVNFFARRVPSHNPRSLKDAVWLLADCAESLRNYNLLNRGRKPSAKCSRQLFQFARVFPAMRTLFEYLSKGRFQPITVYVVRNKTEIVDLKKRGYAFFEDRAMAERILEAKLERLDATEREKQRSNFEIRQATVSFDKGLVLLPRKDSDVSSPRRRQRV